MRTPIATRFLEKVDTDLVGCWEWTGAKTALGYGKLGRGGKYGGSMLAHRFSYEHFVGPIPEGLELDHLCRNPGCVRPDHLEAVSHAENVRRGDSWRINGAKTHCPQGHAYEGENVRVDRNGSGFQRKCRACEQARKQKPEARAWKKQYDAERLARLRQDPEWVERERQRSAARGCGG